MRRSLGSLGWRYTFLQSHGAGNLLESMAAMLLGLANVKMYIPL